MAAIPCMIATGYFYTPKRDEKEGEKEEVSLNDVDDGKTKLWLSW